MLILQILKKSALQSIDQFNLVVSQSFANFHLALVQWARAHTK